MKGEKGEIREVLVIIQSESCGHPSTFHTRYIVKEQLCLLFDMGVKHGS
jgi:hypothetical protein